MTLANMPSTIYDFEAGSTTISQCTSAQVDPQLREFVGRYSGGIDPQQVGVVLVEPKYSIETTDILNALTAADVATGSGSTLATGVTVKAPFQKRAEAGAYLGTLQHAWLVSTGGLLVPTEISATQDSEEGATCGLEFYPVYDGTNDIVAYATAQTLAAQSFSGLWTLSLVEPNGGSALTMVKRVTIRAGIQVVCERYNGSPYPTKCYIKQRDPEIEVESQDLDALAGANQFASLTSLVVFLQKMDDGGDRVAAATAEHIKFTLTGGLQVSPVSGRGNDNASSAMRFKGKTLAKTLNVAIT